MAQILPNNEKLTKSKQNIIRQESVSDGIQNVTLAAKNLFQQKHLKVVRPKSRLKSSFKSTVKDALFANKNAMFPTFNTLQIKDTIQYQDQSPQKRCHKSQ